MMIRSLILSIAAVIVAVSGSIGSAATLEIAAADDVEIRIPPPPGLINLIDGASDIIIEANSPSGSLDTKAAGFTFSLGSIPVGATITAVEMVVDINLFESGVSPSGTNDPTLSIGFREDANGVVDPSDVTLPAFSGGTADVTALGLVSLPFTQSLSDFQQIVDDSAAYVLVGLSTIPNDEDWGLTVRLGATESIFDDAPLLRVTYVPEPGVAAIITLAGLWILGVGKRGR